MVIDGVSCPECEANGHRARKGYTKAGLMEHVATEHIGNMIMITFHVPRGMLNEMDDRVARNEAPNRSELIRYAINEYLRKGFMFSPPSIDDSIKNRIMSMPGGLLKADVPPAIIRVPGKGFMTCHGCGKIIPIIQGRWGCKHCGWKA